MDILRKLNKRQRNNNFFGLFYKQNLKSITRVHKPKLTNSDNCQDLIFLKKEPISNQFENIPKIEPENIDDIKKNIEIDSPNESKLKKVNHLSNSEKNIDTFDSNNLNIEMDKFSSSSCQNISENLDLPKVIDKIESIPKKIVKNSLLVTKKKSHRNKSLFEKFKSS